MGDQKFDELIEPVFGRAMQSLLFGVQALDFAAFLPVAGVLLAAAILASFLPATRAASVSPMRVLRTE